MDKGTKNECRQTPDVVFAPATPTPVAEPKVIAYAADALALLGLRAPTTVTEENALVAEVETYLSGNQVLPGSVPVAHCYCGHQFGSFAGQLGDGAAISLGEVLLPAGRRWELQLKGAGLTPYSRTADGRKVLRSSVREFLCSEAMHHLRVPTTRSGSCVTSRSTVQRDPFYDGRVVDEPCTVITRIAPNFFRFGSFEIFKPASERGGRKGPSAGNSYLKQQLLDHVITAYYPEVAAAHPRGPAPKQELTADHYAHLFEEVLRRTAELVARWQALGFVHGVLNTDNMSIMGLTIDYGPFGFIEHFDPDYTPNGSDGSARYAYDKQPSVCRWNLLKLAEALDPLLPLARAQELLARYDDVFEEHHCALMRAKLGLLAPPRGAADQQLVDDLFAALAATHGDFTDTFVALTDLVRDLGGSSASSARKEAVDACVEKLASRSASPSEQQEMLRRKMKIHRLGMHPQQIQQIWDLIEKSPTQASEMFGGAPIEALRNEIGGEKAKLDRQMGAIQELDRLEGLSPKDKVDHDRRRWSAWVERYVARLDVDADVNADWAARLSGMREHNPTFVLRNWIAQDAILAAEAGDFSKVRGDILYNSYTESTMFHHA